MRNCTCNFIQLTLLIIYDDGLCSLCYTTDLLKNGCLASIGPPYDKNAKMWTFVLFPEHCYIVHRCNYKEPVNFIFWWRRENTSIDPPDAGASGISDISNLFTLSKMGWFV